MTAMLTPISALDESQLYADGQILWRGTVLGTGTPYALSALAGWSDLPGQRGSNQPIPARHGSYPGRKVSEDRVITLDWKSKGVDLAGFRDAMATLRRITAPDEDPQEEPLVVRLDGESWMTWARCTRRLIPTDKLYALGRAAGSVQWEATDPRIYSITENDPATGLALPLSGGLDFSTGGLDFSAGGLDFGGGSSGGLIRATNLGDVPTWPTLEIAGPVTGPIVTIGDRALSFDPSFTVLAGQVLTIVTKPGVRTVELNGVSARPRLWSRQWAPLEPLVPTDIRFTAAAYSSAAELTVRYRHAKH